MWLYIAYEHHVSPSEAIIKQSGDLESKQHISVTPGRATLSSGSKRHLVPVETQSCWTNGDTVFQDFTCQCISMPIDHSPQWT